MHIITFLCVNWFQTYVKKPEIYCHQVVYAKQIFFFIYISKQFRESFAEKTFSFVTWFQTYVEKPEIHCHQVVYAKQMFFLFLSI